MLAGSVPQKTRCVAVFFLSPVASRFWAYPGLDGDAAAGFLPGSPPNADPWSHRNCAPHRVEIF